MPRYNLHFEATDANIKSLLKKLAATFPDVNFNAMKINTNPSRADRLAEAESLVSDARSIVEELQGEMNDWHDSMPENLQESSKAEEVQECADALETIADTLDGVDFSEVLFPSMM